jgi:hypothetical protein
MEGRWDCAAEHGRRRWEMSSAREYRGNTAEEICSEARRKDTEHAETREGLELERVVSCGSGLIKKKEKHK